MKKLNIFILAFLMFFQFSFSTSKIDKELLFSAKKLYESGNYKVALEKLTQYLDNFKNFKKTLLNYSPRVERAYALRGNCHYKLKEFKKSIEDYNKSLKINETQSIVWHNRGLAHLEMGKISEAINSFKRAISINRQQEKSYYYLGISYEKSGNIEKALSEFKKLISINEMNGNGYMKLINIYISQNKLERAKDLLKISLGKGEKPVSIFKLEDPLFDIFIYGYYEKPSLVNQIMEYLRINNFKKAEKLCREKLEGTSLKTQKEREEVMESLGIVYFSEKKDDLALKELNEALKLNPRNILVLNYLGLTYFRMGNFKKSEECFKRGTEIEKNLISDTMLKFMEKVKQ